MTGAPGADLLGLVVDAMDENDLSPEDVAQASGLSRRTVERLVKVAREGSAADAGAGRRRRGPDAATRRGLTQFLRGLGEDYQARLASIGKPRRLAVIPETALAPDDESTVDPDVAAADRVRYLLSLEAVAREMGSRREIVTSARAIAQGMKRRGRELLMNWADSVEGKK